MSKTDKTAELIQFVRFTHEIRKVKRAVLLETNEAHENDAGHCYQLALVGWFLIDNDNLSLDRYRVVGMAMVHDIAEAYAGDVTAFASAQERAAHIKREKAAIQKLRQNWPNFTSLHELIDEYEAHTTPEAQFVYALDKLLPMINNYLFEGRAWKQQGITLDKVKTIKVGKVDVSEPINEYYVSVVKILEANPGLFVNTNNL